MKPLPQAMPYQGSKRRFAHQITALFAPSVDVLYEPFAGSAAISVMAAAQRKAKRFHLNDTLAPLMELWKLILDKPSEIIEGYEKLWQAQRGREREFYDEVRTEFNKHGCPINLMYLLARCVKASVRFNAGGEFNQSPDNRRLGAQPVQMAERISIIHRLFAGYDVTTTAVDYGEVLSKATSRDLVYMDPPYQGVSGGRDQRYVQGLDFDRFVSELEKLNRRSVPYIISFDGACGERKYGRDLPVELGLHKLDVVVGRSSQATLNGQSHETVETLYISPTLLKNEAVRAPERIDCRRAELQMQLGV